MNLNKVDVEKSVLEQYKVILEDWIPSDASIAIAVNYTFIYFRSGHHNFSLSIGSPVPENSIAFKVLHEKKKIDAVMDTSLFDTPYYAIGYPITIDGQLGALVVVLPPLFKIEGPDLYQFLTGKQNEDWIPVPIEQISYIESLQKRTWFYSNKQQYKTAVTLKELQTRLPGTFVRIHRSYIINIVFIKKITRDLTSNFIVHLKDGTELPISQSYINELRGILKF
ncbi:LytTR family transcriptional regulator [Solibacillus sp. MA9]|uniref:LytTR family transcriptional regulator n=1 Tax=Solibacillus palustris TaxID=2908203 RepID=A0ABS9UHC8_9BACL|nr:LytTR family DNA-binding domain-containing protein [Solibacillus sp. MA9]MCH7323765.1 LytTR family transcriptional regulator [Solibacillus sp. MA9]